MKEDIFEELDKDAESELDITKNDMDRYFHEKTINTVKRNEAEKMLDFVRNDKSRYLIVYGEAGSGKSTLFAQFKQQLEEYVSESSSDYLILTNIAGIDSDSCSIDTMLEKWNREIKAKLGIVENEFYKNNESDKSGNRSDEGKSDIRDDFARLLTSAANKYQHVLLLIDSMDSFHKSEKASHFDWLPEKFPCNVQLIATTQPRNEIKKSGAQIMTISGLADEREAQEMIDRLCMGKYGKEMPAKVKVELINKAKTDGFLPLYIKIAASDLMRMTRDDFQSVEAGNSTYIDWMLGRLSQMPDDIKGVYKYVFQRAQDEYGEDFVNFFIRHIAISKEGLRDSDLKSLYKNETGKDLTDVESLLVRMFLSEHLRQDYSGEYWAPEHDQFNIAVIGLMTENEKIEMHAQLAEHLYKLDMSDTLKKNTYNLPFVQSGYNR